jgi:hypothetical protein
VRVHGERTSLRSDASVVDTHSDRTGKPPFFTKGRVRGQASQFSHTIRTAYRKRETGLPGRAFVP